ncbi:hypothetical protein [Mycolicibacterium fortuitum]|uniref:hypothetical protein n=1 Tax=Mycolicibacterium fortuitum TaxID=1766 RepID=UPI0007E937C1|nr:hypothetical protein [Mycolicibacterium fortuitum]OBF77068.1 hypothetical protein A5751_23090 [Mycolicibacterium fortuitum]
MDPRAQQAREHHRKAADASGLADRHRAQRDNLVRQIWATARAQWTYAKLAKAIGCSPELIAKIVNRR